MLKNEANLEANVAISRKYAWKYDKNGTRVNKKTVNLQCVFAYDDPSVFLKSNVSWKYKLKMNKSWQFIQK